MKVRLSPRAAADMEQIALYVAEQSPRAALALIDAIERRFERLTEFPLSGTAREDIAPGVRHLVAGQYLILYRLKADVEIVRVLHGRQHIDVR